VTTVRAAVLDRFGEPLTVEELELDAPGPGEVEVRMTASGVCRSDLHRADGDWGGTGPLVLGHEGGGVVEAVGAGVETPSVGDHVALNWFYPCLDCAACRRSEPWTCTGTRSLENRLPSGRTPLRRTGGGDVWPYLSVGTFAERSVVAAQAAVSIPAEVPAEVAALMGCSLTTGVMAAIRAGETGAGDAVAVIGLGGVGLSIVMGAAVAGATAIVAVDRAPEKLRLALEMGATHTVEGSEPDATVAAIRDALGGAPDIAFEAVGLPGTIEAAISVPRSGGRTVLVGLTAIADRASLDAFSIVDQSRRIVGANYGMADPRVDFPQIARWYLEGRLPVERMIERRIGLEDVNGALEALRGGEGARRVVVF
jgi:S-(hydroxymethyl)glutathione dehydrogenase / alcohol dehydrogenase